MSDNEKRTKPKYESPTVVALGEMAKGAGAICVGGSSADGYCTVGSTASGSGYCSAGGLAAAYCTSNGTAAGAACTTVGYAPSG